MAAGCALRIRGVAMNPSPILCPAAFSPSGESALARALALARWYQCETSVKSSKASVISSVIALAKPESRSEPTKSDEKLSKR
jgi:hypothetical protein